MMKNIFTEHPHSVNETYLQHCKFALKFSAEMLLGGLACLLHAFFPFIFEKTGSNFLFKSIYSFINRMKNKQDERVAKLSELINKSQIDK